MAISTTDLYWAAGFLDGEGSFTGNKKRGGVVVQATQKDTWALEKLKALFGGHIYSIKNKGFSGRDMFLWALQSRRAMGVMFTLYSLLSPYRRQQIEEATERFKSVPFRKDSPEKLWRRYGNGIR